MGRGNSDPSFPSPISSGLRREAMCAQCVDHSDNFWPSRMLLSLTFIGPCMCTHCTVRRGVVIGTWFERCWSMDSRGTEVSPAQSAGHALWVMSDRLCCCWSTALE